MKKTIHYLSLFFLFGSCAEYENTPEQVVLNFTHQLMKGECKNALEYCTGEAEIILQSSIEVGCSPYETTIDSISCTTTIDKANCTCYENREGLGAIAFPYKLEKVGDEWKISSYTKDTSLDDL